MTQFEKYLREFELAAKAIRIAIDAGNYHMIRFATKAAASSLDQMVKHLPADVDADIDAETDVPHTTVSHDRNRTMTLDDQTSYPCRECHSFSTGEEAKEGEWWQMPDGGLMCPACHAAARASVRAAEQTEGCDIVIVKVHGGYAIRLPRQKETNPT